MGPLNMSSAYSPIGLVSSAPPVVFNSSVTFFSANGTYLTTGQVNLDLSRGFTLLIKAWLGKTRCGRLEDNA